MPEAIVNRYEHLFELRLLHHYWLDEGAMIFDLIPDKTKRDRRLQTYDCREFLRVTPTGPTKKAFDALGCVFKETALGCIAAVPAGAVVPLDSPFEFILTVQHPAFYNYTAMTLRPCKVYALYHLPEDKTYRYKENVPVLSNLTGAFRGAGLNKTLFLSREIPAPAADDQVESLVQSGGALKQLTGDEPGGGTQQLNPVTANLPVFLHQGDVPPLVAPSGLAGAPKRGIQLSSVVPDDVFALIRLSALRAGDDSFSLVDGSGHPKPVHPVFQIRFKNRSTTWRYINKSSGLVTSTEPAPLPSTYFGNAGTKQKPSNGLVKVIKSGSQITQLISEVFV